MACDYGEQLMENEPQTISEAVENLKNKIKKVLSKYHRKLLISWCIAYIIVCLVAWIFFMYKILGG